MKRALRLFGVALLALITVAIVSLLIVYPRWYRDDATMGKDWPHEPVSTVTVAQPPQALPSAVILVTLDGVRWQEVFDGVDRVLAARQPNTPQLNARELLPNIYEHFVTHGAVLGHPDGANGFCTANPYFTSLAGYQELLSAEPTACIGNSCGPNRTETFISRLISSGTPCEDVAVFTSWPLAANELTAQDQESIELSAGRERRHHCNADAPRLPDVMNEPPLPGAHPLYRRDDDTTRAALAQLQQRAPKFLHIALGDADEQAHEGNYAGYLEALQRHDRFIGELFAALAETKLNATVLLTTDHGRGRTFNEHGKYARVLPLPESDRTWLMAAGHGVIAQGFIDPGSDGHLADVGATIAALLGLNDFGGTTLCHAVAVPCLTGVPWRKCSVRP